MMLVEGFLAILPVTASTLTIALVLLVLLGRNGLRSAWAMVGGWLVGAWLVLWLAMLGIDVAAADATGAFPPWAQVALGVVALLVGVVILLRRQQRGQSVDPGLARMARLADGLTPVRAAGVGFTLVALSPRQWVFLAPAAAAFTAAGLPAGVVWLPVVGAVLASLGVAVPVVLALVSQRIDPRLMRRAQRWWMRQGDVVSAVIAIAVGVGLVVLGTSQML